MKKEKNLNKKIICNNCKWFVYNPPKLYEICDNCQKSFLETKSKIKIDNNE